MITNDERRVLRELIVEETQKIMDNTLLNASDIDKLLQSLQPLPEDKSSEILDNTWHPQSVPLYSPSISPTPVVYKPNTGITSANVTIQSDTGPTVAGSTK